MSSLEKCLFRSSIHFSIRLLPDMVPHPIIFFLLDEQEIVQKRTFTKWINSHLAKVKETLPLFGLSQ
uniref:Uncharacterized protein n=1 Tax=Sus scrofa TaxID=9823 RepID=A0A8D0YMP3_PIG